MLLSTKPNTTISIPKWSYFNRGKYDNNIIEWEFQSQNGLILTVAVRYCFFHL